MGAKKKLVIVGAGEFAQIAYEYFTHDSDYQIAAFSVESKFIKEDQLCALPVVPLETLERKYSPEQYAVFVAVTQTQLNRVRMRLYREVKAKGFSCANYISSHAFVWRNVTLGDNCFVFENNVLQPFVRVGNNVIFWSGNHIGHRAVIEDDCFVASHVVISGYCRVGARSFLGVNSTLVNNIEIAVDNLIAAGAVVTQSTSAGLIYKGNPARSSKVSALDHFNVNE